METQIDYDYGKEPENWVVFEVGSWGYRIMLSKQAGNNTAFISNKFGKLIRLTSYILEMIVIFVLKSR